MLKRPILSYCEDSLPTGQLLPSMPLEIANRGELDLETYRATGQPVTAVQAYQMHAFHPLHPDADHRQQALAHVHDTLEIAAQLSVPRIVTVCGFGEVVSDRPWERCVDFFGRCQSRASQLGVKMMIEPLSPRRCSAMTDPVAIATLIQTLNAPETFTLMLDTGHLLDSGYDLEHFFLNWAYPIEELQLKGPRSTPPSLDMPVQIWLQNLPTLPNIVCIEHRQPIAPAAFIQLTTTLQQTLHTLATPLNRKN